MKPDGAFGHEWMTPRSEMNEDPIFFALIF